MNPMEDNSAPWVPPAEIWQHDGPPMVYPYYEDPYNPDPYSKM